MATQDNAELITNYLLANGVVAYQKALAHAVGDVCAGLLLSQFWYWTSRIPEERDGWFYKTQDEILEETAMTRREQETARRKLRDLQLIEEDKRGVPAKLWFRVNKSGVVDLLKKKALSQDGGKRHPRMSQSANQVCDKAPDKHGATVHSSIHETTAKTTTQNTAADSPQEASTRGDDLNPAAAALLQDLMDKGMNLPQALWCVTNDPELARQHLDAAAYAPEWEKGLGAYLYVATRDRYPLPPGFLEEKAKEQKQQQAVIAASREKARQGHEDAHQHAYLSYLVLREGELQKNHQEAYSAFLKSEEQTYTGLKRLNGKHAERIRAEFQREENHLLRFSEYYTKNEKGLVLAFWEWDRTLNPEPFKV